MAGSIQNQVQAPANISLVDSSLGRMLILGVTKDVNFNPGIKQELDMAMSNLGVESPVSQRTTVEDPTIKCKFATKSIETIGLALGKKWVKSTVGKPVLWHFGITPTKTSYPASATGLEGTGVVVDPAGVVASALIDEVAEKLTIAAFATDLAAATKSISFGVDGAFKVSPDLIGVPLSCLVPYTLTNLLILSEEYYAAMRMVVTFVNTNKTLLQMEFPQVQPVLDGASINFADQGVEMTFRGFNDGTTCVPYTLSYIPKKRACVV